MAVTPRERKLPSCNALMVACALVVPPSDNQLAANSEGSRWGDELLTLSTRLRQITFRTN